ncbi:hypothetical protein APASM_2082 [Actinosynnema pretiosum subsp. pretiosum]|nr:hypothetical protein APASM_2082 [Actinosynnema pretiosum subsp. pretiosum]
MIGSAPRLGGGGADVNRPAAPPCAHGDTGHRAVRWSRESERGGSGDRAVPLPAPCSPLAANTRFRVSPSAVGSCALPSTATR